jgi:predicted nucleic acid-binding protein
VVSWLDSLAADEVATTAITAAELLYGVERLPDGRRKAELAAAVHGLLSDDFQGRVLAFDEQAASRYAEIVSHRERLGRSIGVADAQIAAICRATGATLATRNTDDFEEAGIDLINPWRMDSPQIV